MNLDGAAEYERGRLARAFRVPAAVLLTALALATFIKTGLSYGLAVVIIDEDGPLEAATVAVYAAVLGDCMYLTLSRVSPAAWCGAVLVGLPMLRELDLHKAFTQLPVTSTRYWRSELPPVPEKAIVACVLVAMLTLMLLAVRASLKPFWRRLRALEPDAVTLASAPVLLVIAAAIDKLAVIDIIVMERDVFFRAVEESLELAAAVCVLAALVQWRRRSRERITVRARACRSG